MNNVLSVPDEVDAVFREFRTCELTTLAKNCDPVTWPLEPFYQPEIVTLSYEDFDIWGQFRINISIRFPAQIQTQNLIKKHQKVIFIPAWYI